MNITLSLSPKEQAALEQRAAAAGTELTAFIREAVQEKLEESDGTAADAVPYEQWRGDFRSWIAGHRSRNPQFDDSRQGVYD